MDARSSSAATHATLSRSIPSGAIHTSLCHNHPLLPFRILASLASFVLTNEVDLPRHHSSLDFVGALFSFSDIPFFGVLMDPDCEDARDLARDVEDCFFFIKGLVDDAGKGEGRPD